MDHISDNIEDSFGYRGHELVFSNFATRRGLGLQSSSELRPSYLHSERLIFVQPRSTHFKNLFSRYHSFLWFLIRTRLKLSFFDMIYVFFDYIDFRVGKSHFCAQKRSF